MGGCCLLCAHFARNKNWTGNAWRAARTGRDNRHAFPQECSALPVVLVLVDIERLLLYIVALKGHFFLFFCWEKCRDCHIKTTHHFLFFFVTLVDFLNFVESQSSDGWQMPRRRSLIVSFQVTARGPIKHFFDSFVWFCHFWFWVRLSNLRFFICGHRGIFA